MSFLKLKGLDYCNLAEKFLAKIAQHPACKSNADAVKILHKTVGQHAATALLASFKQQPLADNSALVVPAAVAGVGTAEDLFVGANLV